MADGPKLDVAAADNEGLKAPPYVPSPEDLVAIATVSRDFNDARLVMNRQYNQFNGRTLTEFIDDQTKRWNGYVPPRSILLDDDQSRIFLNFTRNVIISYLAKVALQRPHARIKAVKKKTGMPDQKLADVLEDLNQFSLDTENGEARFLEAALECTVKGTVVTYEGFRRQTQKSKSIAKYDAEKGKVVFGGEEERTIFDGCYQQVVALEDFYISNAYEPDVQKQPFIIWRQTTTKSEGEANFKKFANWKYVKAGAYVLAGETSTFYRSRVPTDLNNSQVEILRYYRRRDNLHIIVCNGVVLYNGPIPFKDGRYPFAKGIFEPFEVGFFWGMGFPNKIMGEQDLQNTFINMMADKTFGSLLPFGLSSDLDDLIEDEMLQPNKIRKVSDISKWTFQTLPGVQAGEHAMLQTVLNLARENSGDITGMLGIGQGKGRITARQAMMKQQEAMQRLGFSMSFLEDFEVDRTTLRLHHLLQFYSVPKIEQITGEKGEDVTQMLFRDFRLDNVQLSDGRTGTRVVKLVNGKDLSTPDAKAQLENDMSVTEEEGELQGQPTEVLALNVNTFFDFNLAVVIVRNSSYQQSEVLDQAKRQEFANWRLGMTQFGVPVDAVELVKYVEEAYDVDPDRFTPKGGQPGAPGAGGGQDPAAALMAAMGGGQQGGAPGGAPQQGQGGAGPSAAKRPQPGQKGTPNLGGKPQTNLLEQPF